MKSISANWPAPENIKTLITSRIGGYSLPPFDSFNPATHVGDNLNLVEKNRQLLRKQLPAEPNWLDQQHTTNCVNSSDVKSTLPIADASYTTEHNQICVVLTADCMPLLVCNKSGTIVAAIHAGWRGMANGIIEQSIKQLLNNSNESPEQFMVWLGPAISQKNFEVGEEVKLTFTNKYPNSETAFISHHLNTNKYLCDLYKICHIILEQLGVNEIYGGQFCTYEDKEQFYSYRRDGKTGRMASMIWINN